MKRVYISTIFRKEQNRALCGELGYIYCIDWENKKIINDPRGVVPKYNLDSPIGNSHGCRGLCIKDDEIWVASSGANIFIYDINNFALKRELDLRPDVGCLHQIRYMNGYMYLTSTANDRLVILKDDKIHHSIDLLPFVRDRIKDILPYNIVPGKDNLHFNSIAWHPKTHELWMILCFAKTIYNYTANEIFFQASIDNKAELSSPHDLVFMDNGVIVNLASRRETVHIAYNTKKRTVINDNTHLPRKTDHASILNDYGFTRGLAKAEGKLLIGNSPTIIKEFNYNMELQDEFKISDEMHESIFDIALDPRDWNI